MSQSLAVKYRPTTFEEVCGQTVTTKILSQIIKNQNFKNCYLFAGASGCGKTTCARIFANMINKGVGSPIEIDAASHGKVEDVRDIVADATQRSLTGEYKIYIIDECHMISKEGWNAFLKCIEECPKYTIFIFCTTEMQKVIPAVRNRLQIYYFAPIAAAEIKARLEYICKQEGFTNYEAACDLISKVNHGGMRDSISMLEQVADFSTDLNIENTKKVIGELSYDMMSALTLNLLRQDEAQVLTIIENLYNAGKDLKHFINAYLEFLLELVKYTTFKNISVTNLPAYLETIDADYNLSQITGVGIADDATIYRCKNGFMKWVSTVLDIKTAIQYDTAYKTTIEVMLLKLCRREA